jgi:hypothetical protein
VGLAADATDLLGSSAEPCNIGLKRQEELPERPNVPPPFCGTSKSRAPPPKNASAKPRKPKSSTYRVEPIVTASTYIATDDDLSDFFSTPSSVAEEA